jgi:hypothetical protein
VANDVTVARAATGDAAVRGAAARATVDLIGHFDCFAARRSDQGPTEVTGIFPGRALRKRARRIRARKNRHENDAEKRTRKLRAIDEPACHC